jgi:acetyl esterase/lipase
MPSRLRLCAIGLTILLALASARAAEPPANVNFQPDITYGSAGGEDLKLNLSRPKDAAGPLPCIVVIHGGGWAAGNRVGHNDLTWQLAQHGYVSATLSYRFAPKHIFPAQVQDVKCAVRFLRAHAAEYGIDPKRFGAVGFSAGAHLSMMLGTMDDADGLDDSGGSPNQPSKVQAVVSFFGPTDFTVPYPEVTRPIVNKFFAGNAEDKPALAKQASPITYVSTGDAPTLLFQGTNDPLVPYTQAIVMLEAFHKAQVPARLELLAGANHGWKNPELARTLLATLAFFDQYLK